MYLYNFNIFIRNNRCLFYCVFTLQYRVWSSIVIVHEKSVVFLASFFGNISKTISCKIKLVSKECPFHDSNFCLGFIGFKVRKKIYNRMGIRSLVMGENKLNFLRQVDFTYRLTFLNLQYSLNFSQEQLIFLYSSYIELVTS